jgi:hypothetical protein
MKSARCGACDYGDRYQVITVTDISLQANEGNWLITSVTRIRICRRHSHGIWTSLCCTQSWNLNTSVVHTVPEFEHLCGAHSPGIWTPLWCTQSRNLNTSVVQTVLEFEHLCGAHSPGLWRPLCWLSPLASAAVFYLQILSPYAPSATPRTPPPPPQSLPSQSEHNSVRNVYASLFFCRST